jgi:hypothetical protein
MRSFAIPIVITAATALAAAGCGGSGAASPAVPSISQSAQAASVTGGQGNGGAGSARVAAVHAAAQCIREHGIPSYPDPALSADGNVYSDLQSYRLAPQSTFDAIQRACRALLATAGFDPGAEPPPPPQLVRAGVQAAECLRAHGLPQMRDPNAQTPYAPGHGFGFTADEMPKGDKFSPIFQRAAAACQAQLDAETRASTLSALSADG